MCTGHTYLMVQCAGQRPRAVSLGPLGQFTFCGRRLLQSICVSRTNPLPKPPAGLRGLWPSQRNNAKHGLRTLPHKFGGIAPNLYKTQQYKSFTRFFSKNRRGPGGSAPGRPSQRAKCPLAAASETPARRSGRNSLTALLTDAPAREWPAGLRPACRRLRGAGIGDRRRGHAPGRCGPQ